MEYRLGSNKNLADGRLSTKKREVIAMSVVNKFSQSSNPEEIDTPENKPTLTPPPIFCISCNQKTVAHKDSACPACAEKLQNQAWVFVPPSLVIGLLIVFGFGVILLVKWLMNY